MIRIRTNEEYEATMRRIEELRRKTIMDGAEAAEFVALLAAVEVWEQARKASPRSRAKPHDFAA